MNLDLFERKVQNVLMIHHSLSLPISDHNELILNQSIQFYVE